MDAARRQRISHLYHEALRRPAVEREAFLDSSCESDAALRAEIESLLAKVAGVERISAGATVVASNDRQGLGLPQSGLGPGAGLGTYQIERTLGHGGMGVVFLARDTTLRRRVALKVLDARADGSTARAELLREARNAAALNHPNICTVYEVGEANGLAFIAMEYVDGRPLSDLLVESALPLPEAVRHGIEVADALAYAHDHGVIHRDLKAANTMITAAGRLKLVDFGLARRDDPQPADATKMASVAPAGIAVGTPYSMAPEQVRGGSTDARTDVWALGVLLYEMVSGATPFRGATTPELFSAVLRDPPAPLPRNVPADMRAVIECCLQKEPARRYAHARDVRTALEAIRAGTKPASPARRGNLGRYRASAAVGGVAIAALLIGLAFGGLEGLRGTAREPAPIRLAVLPFENLTGDPEQEYFSDGLTEELITQLGRMHPGGLSVIARTSSMRYKNQDVPVDQIGRDLSVDYVLEGSARREGNRVRISATLVEVRGQTQQWADSFDSELSSILALQSDIALGVASSLALTLLPAERARLVDTRSVDPEAYEAYLRGASYRSQLGQADLDQAMAYFELALQKDPSYAMAHAGIASVWSYRQQMQFVAPAEAAPRSRAAIAKALELDDTLAEAHYQLAGVYAWTDWDWAAAEPEFRRAIELGPNHAEARALYSHYLAIVGRPTEAMEQIELARRLDPASDLIQTLYGVLLQNALRFDEAIEQFRAALMTAPTSPLALNGLARSLDLAGRHEEAFAAEKAVRAALGDRAGIEALDSGYAEGGYPMALRRLADTLSARPGRLAPVNVATLYLRAGDNEQGLDWLERAYELRDPNLPYVAIAPLYDDIRSDPRFESLLRRMDLPE